MTGTGESKKTDDEEVKKVKEAKEPKESKDSLAFSPLPSTSDDHYTFALNDSLFNSHCEEIKREDDRTHQHQRIDPPQESLAAKPEPAEAQESEPDPPADFILEDKPIVVDLDVDVEIVATLVDNPVTVQNTPIDQMASTAGTEVSVDVVSDSSDCEIVDVVNGSRNLKPNPFCEFVQPVLPIIHTPILTSESPQLSRMRTRSRKRRRDMLGLSTDPDDIPMEEFVLGPIFTNHRPSTSSYGINGATRSLNGWSDSDSDSWDSYDRHNEAARIIDTVDLSVDTFKPTPVINEVIVVDSDNSFNLASGVSVSEVKLSTDKHQKSLNSSIPDSNCDSSPGAPRLRDCPICLDSFSSSKPVASTFCGHIFCLQCVAMVMKTSKKCPTCRKKLTGKGYHNLFF